MAALDRAPSEPSETINNIRVNNQTTNQMPQTAVAPDDRARSLASLHNHSY